MTPRCPYCNAQGLDRFQAVESDGQFRLICCCQCGAVLGVLPIEQPIETKESPQLVEEKITPPRPVEPTFVPPETPKQAPERPPVAASSTPAGHPPRDLTMSQIGAFVNIRGMYPGMLAFDAPICPKCKIEMVEEKVPEGYKESGKSFWKCPNFQVCKQWLPIKG